MKCEVCSGAFEPKKPNQKVCSSKCRKEKWRRSHAEAAPLGFESERTDAGLHVPRREGHPPLLTPAVQAVIIEAIGVGCPYPIAAAHAGVDHDTLRIWRRKGEHGIAPYADFVKELAQAELDWEVNAVKSIHAAGEKDWRAHLELLSRRIPERWARANREMNPGITQPFRIVINLGDVNDYVDTTLALPPAIDVTPRPKDPDPDLS
jgi:hypothetical protein